MVENDGNSREQLLRKLTEFQELCDQKTDELRQANQAAEGRALGFQSLVEASPDIMARYDKDHRCLYVNPAIAQLKGIGPKKLIGQKLGVVVSDALAQKLTRMIDETVRTGQAKTLEWEYETRSERKFFKAKPAPKSSPTAMDTDRKIFTTRFAPEFSPDGQVASVLAITREVTGVKRLEAELGQARDAQDKANQAKNAFLANMSHEFRTPLNAMIGMVDLALLNSSDADKLNNYLWLAQQSGQTLLALVNDILDLAKIESGHTKLARTDFSIRQTVESTVKSFEAPALNKGLRLRVLIDDQVPDLLVGDQGRLRQVLINLIGNAVKFTSQGGIMVEVFLDESSETLVRLLFTVTDTGMGVPGGMLDSVFDTFTQAHSEQATFRGTGLGLAISRQLVEIMGGHIWVESEAGQGSTFSFTATFAFPEADAQPEAAPSPAASGGLRILLAEDDMVNRLLAVEVLKLLGHRVTVAGNGFEVIQKLKADSFDLVLMDQRMPDMDGTAAVRAIRDGAAGADKAQVPVVALTAHALKGDRERFLAAGMDDYLSKPVDMLELDRVLAMVKARLGEGNPP